MPAPAMVAWAINEFALGAHPAVFMYLAGPLFADILLRHRQRAAAALGGARRSSATGAPPWCSPNPTPAPTSAPGRTKAIEQPDGSWHIDGVKRFITNGDTDDLFENIMHMVLARPEGAGAGHQGPQPVPGAQVPARPEDR